MSYDYITGGKTGYTEKAKRTLVSTASKNNINLIAVTINDSDDWNTHISLYDKIFDNYINYKVLNKGNINVENEKDKRDFVRVKLCTRTPGGKSSD